MKSKRLILLGLVLALLCASCGRTKPDSSKLLVLYFAADNKDGHGSALATEPYRGTGSPSPGDLIDALLSGPTQDGLISPFPKGVSLQSWEWDSAQEGNLRVRLSEQYGGLADISLTLADYCIVLTLSQLDGVKSVEISSDGYASNYRSHPILQPNEAMLSDAALG
ncbi:MAG: GerMN domain-containing protein [Lawsonibacter sp.]|nr:GerMN domain-containing protein [Lawsonibacter sp.]